MGYGRGVENDSLRERLARAEAVLDTAIDAVITIDERGTIEQVNRATRTLFGYEASELVGKNVSILMPSDIADRHDSYLETYAKTGRAHIIGIGRDVEARRKDGTVFPAHLAVGESQIGDRRLFTGILRDLTETRTRDNEAIRLGRIVEDALNEIFVFDDETLRFLQANRRARENLGYRIDELREMTPVDIKPKFDDAAFRELIEPVKSGGKSALTFETTHRRKDGSDYDVEVHLHHDASAHEFVALILDVSERRELQRQVIQAQRMEAVGQLAGGVAHDFNNLLTSIHGSADLIAGRLAADDRSQRAVRRITQAAERGAALTQQLLAFGRRHVTQPESLDMNRSVLQVIDLTERIIGEDIEVETSLHPEPLPIRADPTLLDQVTMNLIVNAGDALPDGGTLRIETGLVNVEADDASRLEMAPGPSAKLSISDNGVGMPPEIVERIFEPFFTTKEVGKGTGLGLSTVHGIVKQSGWGLDVTTREGEGSRFDVVIPLAASPLAERGGIGPSPQRDDRRATILLVEDDALVRDLAREVLEGAGHTVWVATTPEEALDRAASRPSEIDLLLSDVVMPGMTGVELARRLRGVLPSLPILLMSGYPNRALEARGAIDSGFPLLAKPFSNEALLGEVARLAAR